MVNAFELKRELEARGFKAKISVVEKNGVMKTGISILSDNIITPVFYINDCIGSPADVAKSIINVYFDYKEDCNGYVETVKNLTWDKAKDNIYICVQPFVNEANYITKGYLDLQMYVRLYLDHNTSVKVDEDIVNMFNISELQLWERARENTEKILVAEGSGAILQVFDDNYDESDMDKLMYPLVLSTKTRMYGASWICFKDKLDKFVDLIGEDFYIIPSSIHEILLVPCSYIENPIEMKRIILEVNDAVVDPTEILSYNVYKYYRAIKDVILVI